MNRNAKEISHNAKNCQYFPSVPHTFRAVFWTLSTGYFSKPSSQFWDLIPFASVKSQGERSWEVNNLPWVKPISKWKEWNSVPIYWLSEPPNTVSWHTIRSFTDHILKCYGNREEQPLALPPWCNRKAPKATERWGLSVYKRGENIPTEETNAEKNGNIRSLAELAGDGAGAMLWEPSDSCLGAWI